MYVLNLWFVSVLHALDQFGVIAFVNIGNPWRWHPGYAGTCSKGNCVSVVFTSQCMKIWLVRVNIASCTVHTILGIKYWMFLRNEQGALVLLALRSFLCYLLKWAITVLKPKDEHTPVVLDFMKDFECFGNTKYEHCKNRTTCEKLHHIKLCRSWIFWSSLYRMWNWKSMQFVLGKLLSKLR